MKINDYLMIQEKRTRPNYSTIPLSFQYLNQNTHSAANNWLYGSEKLPHRERLSKKQTEQCLFIKSAKINPPTQPFPKGPRAQLEKQKKPGNRYAKPNIQSHQSLQQKHRKLSSMMIKKREGEKTIAQKRP
jgi:hypothetical protein